MRVWTAVFTTRPGPWTSARCPPNDTGAIRRAVDHAGTTVDAVVGSTLRRHAFSPIHSAYYRYYLFITI